MRLRVLAFVAFVAFCASRADAQTISYNLRIYNAGTAVIVSTTVIPSAQVICNQTPPTSTVNKNPDKAVFDDQANAGRACIYTDPGTGPLLDPTLKFGNYEATMWPFIPGTVPLVEATESNRAPFQKTPLPLTNVRLIK